MAETPWETLGISKATYYRHKKLETGQYEYLISDWISFKDSGLGTRVWSPTYKSKQLLYLNLFLKQYRTVSSDSVKSFLEEIHPERYSSRIDRHAALSSFSKYLNQVGKLSQDEYQKIRQLYPRKPYSYQPDQRIITTDQLTSLQKALEIHHRSYDKQLNKALFSMMLGTAIRASECSGLLIEDLRFSQDPREAKLMIRQGKGGYSRLLPFPLITQDAVKVYFNNYRPVNQGQNLFYAWNPRYGFTKMTKDNIARRFKRLADLSGVNFSAHSLRHYRITQWANNPMIPITVTQKWAGHHSLEVTQKYVHIGDMEALKAAVYC